LNKGCLAQNNVHCIIPLMSVSQPDKTNPYLMIVIILERCSFGSHRKFRDADNIWSYDLGGSYQNMFILL
jgi:hypothetical protein